jgi:hypothetical protein
MVLISTSRKALSKCLLTPSKDYPGLVNVMVPKNVTRLPKNLPKEVGDFLVGYRGSRPSQLTSLKNSPRTVYGVCAVNCPRLKTLQGGPELIGYGFILKVSANTFVSFKGGPRRVAGIYQVISNNLSSLENLSIDRVGMLDFSECVLKSLSGISKEIKSADMIVLPDNFESNLLELLGVNISIAVSSLNPNRDLFNAISIVNEHLHAGDNIFRCKLKLMQEGLKQFAGL